METRLNVKRTLRTSTISSLNKFVTDVLSIICPLRQWALRGRVSIDNGWNKINKSFYFTCFFVLYLLAHLYKCQQHINRLEELSANLFNVVLIYVQPAGAKPMSVKPMSHETLLSYIFDLTSRWLCGHFSSSELTVLEVFKKLVI